MKNTLPDESVYKDALDALYDGVAIFDAQGNPYYVNQAHLAQIGTTREEWSSTPLQMHPSMNPPIASSSPISLQTLTDGKPASGLVQYPRTGKTCLVSSSLVQTDTKRVGVVAVIRDLTELLELQKKVRDLDALKDNYLKELQKLKSLSAESNPASIKTSRSMELLYEKANRIAKIDVPVLILGETGVGKDFMARHIHDTSGCAGPYVKLNCNAIPATLLESELFGYNQGAFTGANKQGKPGLLELADNGTLFLDEIGDLPLDLQVKLLGVLQDKTFNRIGGIKTIHSNFRIIAATNVDLEKKIKEGTFRQDLFYRLNVITFTIPPLRERWEDIIPLATKFMGEFCFKYEKEIAMGDEAASALLNYAWPGNIRELRNTIERMVVLETEPVFSKSTVTNNLLHHAHKTAPTPILAVQSTPTGSLKENMDNYEKKMIAEALSEHKTLAKTAHALDVDLSTLVRKKKKYNL